MINWSFLYLFLAKIYFNLRNYITCFAVICTGVILTCPFEQTSIFYCQSILLNVLHKQRFCESIFVLFLVIFLFLFPFFRTYFSPFYIWFPFFSFERQPCYTCGVNSLYNERCAIFADLMLIKAIYEVNCFSYFHFTVNRKTSCLVKRH